MAYPQQKLTSCTTKSKKNKINTASQILEIKKNFILEYSKNINPIKYFEPQDYQQSFFNTDKKDVAIFGGNRTGKTLSGAAKVVQFCINNPKRDVWCGTWADMSIPVQQKKISELLPKTDIVEYGIFSEKRGFTNKIIIFKNGSIIRFKTYEQGRESWQGTAKHLIWLDEEAPQDIVSECRARLIDFNGVLLRTMTPLNGITYTYDEVVLNEKNSKEIWYEYWNTFDNKKINQESAKDIIGQYSEKEAGVRSTGHFANLTTGSAYYPFTDDNIIKSFEYLNYRPLEISCDFNVDLMCWNIGQELNGKDYTFDFVELEGQANTELLCDMLLNKYVNHTGGWIFYGDIAGSQRSPATSKTNWAIIKEKFPNATIYYQSIRNIKDRVDSTNARICNSKGERSYFVTENCKRLIKDLRQVTWEMLLNKNKAGKLTHTSDGESYKHFWKYPLTGKIKTSLETR